MNISKVIPIITAGIPIAGILIGGIAFGLNFKTDVENIKEDVANQVNINTDVEERFNSIPAAYDDSLVWSAIDNIHIPDMYDDSYLDERIQNLALQSTELRTELDSLDIQVPDVYDDSYLDGRVQSLALQITEVRTELDAIDIQDMEAFDDSDLRGRLAELEGQLNALANMDMTSDDGTVDLGPLLVGIATVEGAMTSLKASIDNIKSDIRIIKTDITTLERQPKSDGSTKTIENRYDDSDLRTRLSTVERQVNSIPTTTSSGTTIQRVENPFDDASLRSDISALQTAVAVLQASGGQSYDDSALQDRIDDIQWELENIDLPIVSPTPTDTTWLENLIYQIKDELTWRIDALELAADATTSDNVYTEKWMFEDLQYEVMHIQEQVWELQTLTNEYENSQNNSTTSSNNTTTTPTSGRSWDGAWDEPYLIFIEHVDSNGNHEYTGDYWMDGYWDGKPVWINYVCGTPGGQWEYCYVFKYNYTSWVLQPLPPSTEWLANSFNDNGNWPWEGSWAGDVNSVKNMD